MLTNTSVIYIDPFVDKSISFNGKEFGVSRERLTKVASRVSYNDIIIHSFKAASTMTPSDLKTMVEIKMYEEAGLDLQKKYKILYITKELENSESLLVEGFALEESNLKTSLATVLKKEKYIDFLALPFLTFSTLYTHKILAPKNDLFIFIDKDEAFIALYKGGRYVSTKSIMCLEEMQKKLIKEDIELDIEQLKELLANKGLESTLYEEKEWMLSTAVQTLFVEIFTKINDVLTHNRNVFGIESVDRIFMNTANARVKGLKDFLLSFGYENTTVQDFKLIKESSSETAFSSIASMYAQEQCSLPSSEYNATLFVRPPQFLKTEVGKFSLLSAASLALGLMYPLYLLVVSQQMDEQIAVMSEQLSEVQKSTASFQAKLTQLNNDIVVATTLKNKQHEALENVKQSIDQLYDMKISSKTYVDFIARVNKLLKEHHLMVRGIEQKGSSKMIIEVVAKQNERDTIATFMEALLKEGFVGVTTDEVRFDALLYISKIEIAR